MIKFTQYAKRIISEAESMFEYKYEDALHLIDTQYPASSEYKRKAMAVHILNKKIDICESAERILNIDKYWSNFYINDYIEQ